MPESAGAWVPVYAPACDAHVPVLYGLLCTYDPESADVLPLSFREVMISELDAWEYVPA